MASARASSLAGPGADTPAPVALVFDYESAWAWEIQPQGRDFSYLGLVFETYRALRRLGQSIDILPPDTADLSAYGVVLAPGVMTLGPALSAALERFRGVAILGPRTNAKTPDFAIPEALPPGIATLDCRVVQVESLRPGLSVPLAGGGAFTRWREVLGGSAPVIETTADGAPAIMRWGGVIYVGGWPDPEAWDRLLRDALTEMEIPVPDLPDTVRIRDLGGRRYVFNHGTAPAVWEGRTIAPADLLILPLGGG